ncbi:hypothetical protein LRS10_20155 [Phenylobacterium sp. J426]|uniref:T-complex 10 C-terminal domain-containing protein n=1 Tax=Phenylobacterium sp. J426 TaxID=2898439 RepID=UPI00215125BC|nr:T-complex 10 C-terminal domain-containing protein [Phenylobacterium sp. J426]MCR5876255.1 hypothetical protein [Phenylobacterium sp. J426]
MIKIALALLAFTAAACATSVSTVGPDATDVTTQADGSVVRTYPGGIRSMTLPDGSVVESDHSGKTPVLCAWRLYVTVQEVGARCFPGQDAAFQRELATSIGRIEGFIRKNQWGRPAAQELLSQKTYGVADIERMGRDELCRSDAVELYRDMKGSPGDLRRATQDMLSTPRKPVTNPCV